MMPKIQPSVTRGSWHGERAITYTTTALTMVVLPDRGAKIASLADHDGHEWLVQPELPLRGIRGSRTSLLDGDLFGWDECCPTVEASTFNGRKVADHGEVWNRSWQEEAPSVLSVTSPSADYVLTRSCRTPDGTALELQYSLTARQTDLAILWTAHPLLAAPPGTRVVTVPPTPLVDQWNPQTPTLVKGTIGIDDIPIGHKAKLATPPHISVSGATLILASSRSLTMEWDATITPYLSLWLDTGVTAPTPTIAIEPATGHPDTAEAATDSGNCLNIPVGDTVLWTLTLRSTS